MAMLLRKRSLQLRDVLYLLLFPVVDGSLSLLPPVTSQRDPQCRESAGMLYHLAAPIACTAFGEWAKGIAYQQQLAT